MRSLILLLLILSSCINDSRESSAKEIVHLSNYLFKVKGIRLTKGKYNHLIVSGAIVYKGKEYIVESKPYSGVVQLKDNDEIYVNVTIYFMVDEKDKDNLYDDIKWVETKPIDLSKYWKQTSNTMIKLKGKLKSISVKEVTEGMQVIYQNAVFTCNDGKVFNGRTYCNGVWCPVKELETIVVESFGSSMESNGICTDDLVIKQLPLKYSQWQSAIDYGLVDSDKEVEFEIKEVFLGGTGKELKGIYIDDPSQSQFDSYRKRAAIIQTHAQIIPQPIEIDLRKHASSPYESGLVDYSDDIPQTKRMYSEEEVINYMNRFVCYITGSDNDFTVQVIKYLKL